MKKGLMIALTTLLVVAPMNGIVSGEEEAPQESTGNPKIPMIIPDIPVIPSILDIPEMPVLPEDLLKENDDQAPSVPSYNGGVIETPIVVQNRMNLNSFLDVKKDVVGYVITLKDFMVPENKAVTHWVINLDTKESVKLSLTKDELILAEKQNSSIIIELRTNIGAIKVPIQEIESGVDSVSLEIMQTESNKVNFKTVVKQGNSLISLEEFKSIVEKEISLPQQPSKNTTILFEKEKKASFTPAYFFERDGQHFAKVLSRHNGTFSIVTEEKKFTDSANHWAKGVIDMLSSKGIIQGMTESTFAPNENIDRAQFAILLVRSFGEDLSTINNFTNFEDVNSNDWFKKGISIASQMGLVMGKGKNEFKPNDPITREEMVVMITRALHKANSKPNLSDTELSEILSAFEDSGSTSDWAKDAFAIAVKTGIVNGKTDTTFAPKDLATRAEAATMLKGFLEYIKYINE